MEAIDLVEATEPVIHDLPAAFMLDPTTYRASVVADALATACAELWARM